MLLILVSFCGLITCVSQHKHLLVHLSCHSITKTKQGPFTGGGRDGGVGQCAPLGKGWGGRCGLAGGGRIGRPGSLVKRGRGDGDDAAHMEGSDTGCEKMRRIVRINTSKYREVLLGIEDEGGGGGIAVGIGVDFRFQILRH